MALAPAYKMAMEEPKRRAPAAGGHEGAGAQQHAAPGSRRQEGRGPEAGRSPAKLDAGRRRGEQLRDARPQGRHGRGRGDLRRHLPERPSRTTRSTRSWIEVDDATEVHRVVLVSRAWDLINFVGAERAHTMLRQSVHYCVKAEENPNHAKYNQPLRELLPKLLDQHKLIGTKPGTKNGRRRVGGEVRRTRSSRPPRPRPPKRSPRRWPRGSSAEADRRGAVAGREPTRAPRPGPAEGVDRRPNKPVGSVHGDSVGVHCLRHDPRVAEPRRGPATAARRSRASSWPAIRWPATAATGPSS